MKSKLIFIAAIITICSPCNSGAKDDKAAINWENFDKGIAISKQQKKPVIIDFYADWCYWCKVMDKETFSDKEVIRMLGSDFITIRLDMEKPEKFTYQGVRTDSNKFASALGVSGLPSLAFLDKDGVLLDVVPGYIKADLLKNILGYIADGCYKLQVSFNDYINGKKDCKRK